MKYLAFTLVVFALFVSLLCAGEVLFRSGERVQVRYQYKTQAARSWTNSSAVLAGFITESMLENQIRSRHPNAEVRVLAAHTGTPARFTVRYQYQSAGARNWTNSSAVLTGVATESMAHNQLCARHSGCDVRVLSIRKQ